MYVDYNNNEWDDWCYGDGEINQID